MEALLVIAGLVITAMLSSREEEQEPEGSEEVRLELLKQKLFKRGL